MAYSSQQLNAIGLTERLASVFSLLGCAFVIGTFAFSERFRKPVNRLILYAVFGNIIYTISTLMATAGIEQGTDAPLCQAQAFLIQAFLPADALWNLSMALNVYVTVFKHYDTSQLRAREPYYHIINYGVPFCIALAYCFIETAENGKVYGNAIIWCWITAEWDYLRIATCYGPAWLCIIASFTIYVMAGFEILKKRTQLRSAGAADGPSRRSPNRLSPRQNSDAQVGSELANFSSPTRASFLTSPTSSGPRASLKPGSEYSVTVKGGSRQGRDSRDIEATPSRARQRTSAIEANTAAWRYTKCCLLFFASLLITWLPSSVNRLYAVVNPNVTPPFGLSYVAALVLPLTGFWNSLIYITTSWSACKSLFYEDIIPLFRRKPLGLTRVRTFRENISARSMSFEQGGYPGPHRPYNDISQIREEEEGSRRGSLGGLERERESEQQDRHSADDSLTKLHIGMAR